MTGVLLAELYGSFPEYRIIEFETFGGDLLDRRIDKDDYDGGFGWSEFVRSSVTWLRDAGYVWIEPDSSDEESVSVRLSQEGLKLLNSTPESLEVKEPLGKQLKRSVKDGAVGTLKGLVSKVVEISVTGATKALLQP